MGNKSNRKTFLSKNIISRIYCGKRQTVTMSDNNDLKFGCLFDIDGVLLRGKTPIPVAAEAMKMIYKNGQFTVPTVFLHERLWTAGAESCFIDGGVGSRCGSGPSDHEPVPS